MFYVFYRILSLYLERITTTKERPVLMDALHYYMLAILAIITALKATHYVIVVVQNVTQSYSDLTSTYLNISASQQILCWLASLELAGCTAFVMVKAGQVELSRRVSVLFLALEHV
jgi:membrane-anchored protein YejM (alkaline phosphatase superfamily)